MTRFYFSQRFPTFSRGNYRHRARIDFPIQLESLSFFGHRGRQRKKKEITEISWIINRRQRVLHLPSRFLSVIIPPLLMCVGASFNQVFDAHNWPFHQQGDLNGPVKSRSCSAVPYYVPLCTFIYSPVPSRKIRKCYMKVKPSRSILLFFKSHKKSGITRIRTKIENLRYTVQKTELIPNPF